MMTRKLKPRYSLVKLVFESRSFVSFSLKFVHFSCQIGDEIRVLIEL